MSFSIDDAQVEDRNPKLSEDGDFKLKIVLMKEIDGNDSGRTFIAEYEVLESNKDEDPVGSMRAVTFTNLDGPKNKVSAKLARLRMLLAACLNCDHKQPPSTGGTWGQIKDMAQDENSQPFTGCEIRCKTGKTRSIEGGYTYVPHTFFPV